MTVPNKPFPVCLQPFSDFLVPWTHQVHCLRLEKYALVPAQSTFFTGAMVSTARQHWSHNLKSDKCLSSFTNWHQTGPACLCLFLDCLPSSALSRSLILNPQSIISACLASQLGLCFPGTEDTGGSPHPLSFYVDSGIWITALLSQWAFTAQSALQQHWC